MTAEGLVGAVFAVIHARILEPERGSLIELLGPLMSMIVLPYLGVRAAAGELKRAADIARIAWHIGNRHTPLQVLPSK